MPLKRNHTYRRQAYKTGSTFSVGPTAARYLIIILLAAFSLMYIIQSAQGSDALVQLQNLESSQTNLNQEMTTLQVNATRLQSLQTLNQTAGKDGLVPIDGSVDSVTVPAPAQK